MSLSFAFPVAAYIAPVISAWITQKYADGRVLALQNMELFNKIPNVCPKVVSGSSQEGIMTVFDLGGLIVLSVLMITAGMLYHIFYVLRGIEKIHWPGTHDDQPGWISFKKSGCLFEENEDEDEVSFSKPCFIFTCVIFLVESIDESHCPECLL